MLNNKETKEAIKQILCKDCKAAQCNERCTMYKPLYALDFVEKYKKHNYPDEIPTEEKEYLVQMDLFGTGYCYKIFTWFNEKKNAQGKDEGPGFYDYDSDIGYFKRRDVLSWRELDME